ncbi:VCBS domain-containing protein, partial [Vibrio anguillarum]
GTLGGTLQLYGNGNYFYHIDNSTVNHLAKGQEAKETFTIHSVDGTPHQVEFVIEGTNDAPVANIVTLSNGIEDTHYQMQASQFGFTDVDSGDTLHAITITDIPAVSQGKFVLDGQEVSAGQSISTAD